MQRELCLRLIKDGKIVGYELHRDKNIYHFEQIRNEELPCHILEASRIQEYLIDYDSFELGIKVGDEWWFEGDIFSSEYGGLTLVYKEEWSCWGFRNESAGFLYSGVLINSVFKRIRTIHDE